MTIFYAFTVGLIVGACGATFVVMSGVYHPDAPEHLTPPK